MKSFGRAFTTVALLVGLWGPASARADYSLKLLDTYGSFALDEKSSANAMESLKRILRALGKPGDPKFNIVFVNSAQVIAHIEQGSKRDATIVLSKGLLDLAESEDDLAGVIAHEMAHSAAYANTGHIGREVRSMHEEIFVADHGGMRRMLDAGYDPRAYREMYLRIVRRNPSAFMDSPLIAAGSTHPDDRIRVTGLDGWLSKEDRKSVFPRSRPLDENLVKAQKANATTPAPKPPKQEPPRLMPERPAYRYEPPPPRKDQRITEVELIDALLKDPEFSALTKKEQIEAYSAVFQSRHARISLAERYFMPVGRRDLRPLGNLHLLTELESRVQEEREFQLRVQDISLASVENKERKALVEGFRDFALSNGMGRDGAYQLSWIRSKAMRDKYEFILSLQDSLVDRPVFPFEEHSPIKEQAFAVLIQRLETEKTPKNLALIFDGLGGCARFDLSLTLDLWPKREQELFFSRLPDLYEAAVIQGYAMLIRGEGWPIVASGRYSGKSLDEALSKRLGNARKNLFDSAIFDRRIPLAVRAQIAGGRDSKLLERFLKTEIRDLAELLSLPLSRETKVLALELNPEWKVTSSDALRFADTDEFWVKGWTQFRRVDEVDERWKNGARDMLKADGSEDLIRSLDKFIKKKSGPAYDYSLDESERLQKLLIERLKAQGTYPSDSIKQHELLLALSKRGPTEYTDQMIRDLYLDPGFNCRTCMQATLEAGALWDFGYRAEVYERTRPLWPENLSTPAKRSETIIRELERVHGYFPEESVSRMDLLERFTNRIAANQVETALIEAAKGSRDANMEAVALRAFSGMLTKLHTPESQLELIKFLVGKGEPPDALKETIKTVGKDRLLRQFESFSPEVRALVLNPILSPPSGLYTNPEYKKQLVGLCVDGLGDHAGDGKLLIDSLLHAVAVEAPYQESLTLSFMLGQVRQSKLHPGEKLRTLLESMGGTGVSIGQKLYQRRLVPPDWLPHLADMTDKSRSPTRSKIFDMTGKALGTERVDEVLEIVEELGTASSKVVLRVRYKSGTVTVEGDQALKLLHDHFEHMTEIELKKLDRMIDFMEKEGGSKYKKYRSALEAVKRSLRLQADIRAEEGSFKVIQELYRAGKVDPHGFVWKVAAPRPDVGAGATHTHQEVAAGKSLKSLTEPERQLVYPAIYDREEEILFAAPNADDKVLFEGDRHIGNYKVDLSGTPPVISVIDYPLLSHIPAKRREGVFQVLGLLDFVQRSPRAFIPSRVSAEITRLVTEVLSDSADPARAKSARTQLAKALRKSIAGQSRDLSESLFQLFAVAEENGVTIAPAVHDYLTALGHAEHYAAYRPAEGEANAFRAKVRVEVTQALEPFISTMTGKDKIQAALADLMSRFCQKKKAK